jgi:hypothetical protein
MIDFYSEDEVLELVGDMDDLREFLNGTDSIKIVDGVKYYNKHNVDIYINR